VLDRHAALLITGELDATGTKQTFTPMSSIVRSSTEPASLPVALENPAYHPNEHEETNGNAKKPTDYIRHDNPLRVLDLRSSKLDKLAC